MSVVEDRDEDEGQRDIAAEFEEAIRQNGGGHYRLRLFLTGMSPRSVAALENLRAICEQYLPGRYDLEVVDVLQEPERAVEANLIAAPTLIKELPLPVRKLLGDLSDTERVLVGLDLVRK